MKKIKIITSSVELEDFVNKTDIEIIQIDIKAVEQSCFAQEWFIAVIFTKKLFNRYEKDYHYFNRTISPDSVRIKTS